MKKLLFMSVATIMAISASAQEIKKIRVYEGNTVVFERNYDTVDSVVFADVHDVPGGALSGKFSVSDKKQVVFSRGNLQYVRGIWQFAENQYDIIGNANNVATCTIDLFTWGTGDNPLQTRTNSTKNNYYDKFIDWGTNPIYNGGNAANLWRTLDHSEWSYLLSHHQFGRGTVNGVCGIILLPSNWTAPNGLSVQKATNNWTTNQYSKDDWAAMESSGAVFLPCAGFRHGLSGELNKVGSGGFYWTPSYIGGYLTSAIRLGFEENSLTCGVYFESISDRQNGLSVRLVQDVE